MPLKLRVAIRVDRGWDASANPVSPPGSETPEALRQVSTLPHRRPADVSSFFVPKQGYGRAAQGSSPAGWFYAQPSAGKQRQGIQPKQNLFDSRPQARIKCDPFSARACTWPKTPLGLQTCEMSVLWTSSALRQAANFLLSVKRPRLFTEGSAPPRPPPGTRGGASGGWRRAPLG